MQKLTITTLYLLKDSYNETDKARILKELISCNLGLKIRTIETIYNTENSIYTTKRFFYNFVETESGLYECNEIDKEMTAFPNKLVEMKEFYSYKINDMKKELFNNGKMTIHYKIDEIDDYGHVVNGTEYSIISIYNNNIFDFKIEKLSYNSGIEFSNSFDGEVLTELLTTIKNNGYNDPRNLEYIENTYFGGDL